MNTSINVDVSKLNSAINTYLGEQIVNLIHMQSCQSTNMECMRLAQHGAVVIADQQIAGRGRRGRQWHSPANENIYCSIGIKKKIPANLLGLISLQTGVSIAQVLEELSIPDISLKWPNDILFKGKKLGGILIEAQALAPDEFFLVIGFGLNINLNHKDEESIDQPAASLSMTGKGPFPRATLLVSLIGRILQAVNGFSQHSVAALIDRFERFDILRGEEVKVVTSKQSMHATYLGIEPNGHVRVQTAQGEQSFAAAEISLRQVAHVTD